MEKEILQILKNIQSDIGNMKNDISNMKNDISNMKNDIGNMQGQIKHIKITQNEHTQILRALEHKTDVIAAQQENLKHEVAELKGEAKGIRRDLGNVEIITASNWSDIVKLKAIK